MPTLVKRRWQADLEAFGGRKAKRGFFYEAFVPDWIADLDLAVPVDVAEAAVLAATRAVRALGAEPPRSISWEALARRLLRTESVASSRIEGLEISQRRLARADFGKAHGDLTAESVLGNVAAMEAAIDIGSRRSPLGPRDLLAVHRALLKRTPDRHLGGRLRTTQGWIGGGSTPADADSHSAPGGLGGGSRRRLVPVLFSRRSPGGHSGGDCSRSSSKPSTPFPTATAGWEGASSTSSSGGAASRSASRPR